MDEFVKNYISWRFDEKYTVKQQLKRLKELEKNILFLFKKMYCYLIRKSMWEKIVDKYCMLLVEYRDLIEFLYEKKCIEEAYDFLEEKMTEIKEKSDYCFRCFVEVNEIFCVCEKCEICGRRELCFC